MLARSVTIALSGLVCTGCGALPSAAPKAESTSLGRIASAPPRDGGQAGTLFQVIVNVRDMPGQVAFYRNVMGFPVVYPPTGRPEDEDFVRFDTGGTYLVLHRGRTHPNAGDEPRLSFITQDVRAVRRRLLDGGVAVAEIRSPAPGVLVADARDPEGNAFHIEEHVRRP